MGSGAHRRAYSLGGADLRLMRQPARCRASLRGLALANLSRARSERPVARNPPI